MRAKHAGVTVASRRDGMTDSAERTRDASTARVATAAEPVAVQMSVVAVSRTAMVLERVGDPLAVGAAVSIVPSFWPRDVSPLAGVVESARPSGAALSRIGV